MTNDAVTRPITRPIHDYRIRIAHDGTWYHDGAPIRREALIRLFSTVLMRQEDGQYWLETPAERGTIEVEDAPFIIIAARQLDHDHDTPMLGLDSNLGHHIIVGENHPIYTAISPVTGELTPYVRMDKGLTARIGRSVYYQLVEWGQVRDVQGQKHLGLESDGAFFSLGPVDEH
ncbi:MAG: DUF1285 domain-containing protein [Pseudomonadota bacterium]